MKTFRFLDHRADLYIEGSGTTFAHAIEAVADALFHTIATIDGVTPTSSFSLEERADTLDELIVFFFSRLLYEIDERRVFPIALSVKELSFDPPTIRAVVETVPSSPHLAKGVVIKAVTFHGLVARTSPPLLRVLFDV